MGLVGIDKDEIVEFIPEYGGNRDSDDPTIIKLKFVSYAKVQKYARMIATRAKGSRDDTKIARVSQDVQKIQFVENVEGILNYTVGGREVTDADEFYETASTALIIEIIKAMEDDTKLKEGQRKN